MSKSVKGKVEFNQAEATRLLAARLAQLLNMYNGVPADSPIHVANIEMEKVESDYDVFIGYDPNNHRSWDIQVIKK